MTESMNRHARRKAAKMGIRHVIFFRKEGWYPVVLREGETVLQHVELNPGTLKVEDIDGNVLWSLQ